MHPLGYRTWRSLFGLSGALVLATIGVRPAAADLVHKYTFNANNANDSVGGANGTVVDNTGISTYTGGAVNLTANNGAGSNQDFTNPATVGAFVDLPNDIFTNAVQSDVGSGEYGQVTLETWFTIQENRTWSEMFVFGTSDGGEGSSSGGGGQSYVALIPQSGPGDFRATTKSPAVESSIIGGAPLATNQRHHVVLVLDQLDSDGGVNLNGTATLYLNNGSPVKAPIEPFIDTMVNNNNWLGRSQWPDPLFDGLIDEFRIYNHALTAGQVATNFTTGPEPAPLPVLVVNRDTGAITLANESAGNIQVKGYSISSASGSLNPAAWTSIDAGDAFDPNGTWTSSASSNTEIAESVTGGTLDGGSLNAGTSRGIGTPWLKTPFQDLVFSFTLGDNSTGTGQIQYSGSAPVRSDLNGDGSVTTADWAIFLPNSYTDLSGEPGAQAYLKGDLDGDLDNDFEDYRLFKSDFIAANGEAAFAALAGAVPEPTSMLLAAVATFALASAHRRKHA